MTPVIVRVLPSDLKTLILGQVSFAQMLVLMVGQMSSWIIPVTTCDLRIGRQK